MFKSKLLNKHCYVGVYFLVYNIGCLRESSIDGLDCVIEKNMFVAVEFPGTVLTN